MEARAARLLLKAVNALPTRERDLVLVALVRSALSPTGGASAAEVATTATAPTASLPRAQQGSAPMPPEISMTGPSGAWGTVEASGPTAMLPVRLPPDLHERLRRWSNEHGFSMASVVRGLVERFLDEQDRPRRAGGRPRATATGRGRPRKRPTSGP